MNIILYAKYGNWAMCGSKMMCCIHYYMSFLIPNLLASVLATISINGFLVFVNKMLPASIKIFNQENKAAKI